jgi:3alpha(or 20beta)-hydroxysteroid dehydrogenase
VAGRLEGKVALISGASRGMGASHARRFVAEGAFVILGDVLDEQGRTAAEELEHTHARYTHLDVTSEESWAKAVGVAIETFGSLDILVNNAGIRGREAPLEEITLDSFVGVVMVNQVGTWLGMKHAGPALREHGGGSIVNISSSAGLKGSANAIAYVSTKWAVRGMTKTAAIELGQFDIRVNSVHPGAIATEMLVKSIGPDMALKRVPPIQRVGAPEEVSNLIVFLASDESSYCTGGEFAIDGGLTLG